MGQSKRSAEDIAGNTNRFIETGSMEILGFMVISLLWSPSIAESVTAIRKSRPTPGISRRNPGTLDRE